MALAMPMYLEQVMTDVSTPSFVRIISCRRARRSAISFSIGGLTAFIAARRRSSAIGGNWLSSASGAQGKNLLAHGGADLAMLQQVLKQRATEFDERVLFHIIASAFKKAQAVAIERA